MTLAYQVLRVTGNINDLWMYSNQYQMDYLGRVAPVTDKTKSYQCTACLMLLLVTVLENKYELPGSILRGWELLGD